MAQSTIERAKFFGIGEASQLLDDLYMEVDPHMVYVDRRAEMPEFGFIAWFLRNYLYLPMSAIQTIMPFASVSGSKGSLASKSIETYKSSCVERPESLDARNYDTLQVFKQILAKYYNAPSNKSLDLCNEGEEDCLLYQAHLECGHYDKPKRQGGGEINYKLTPSEPSLITLLDILARIGFGEKPEDICRDWSFISNH
jgi:hypothetical protein